MLPKTYQSHSTSLEAGRNNLFETTWLFYGVEWHDILGVLDTVHKIIISSYLIYWYAFYCKIVMELGQVVWEWDHCRSDHYLHALCSPEDDKEAQEAVDTFFSQCTILPSPWTTGRKTTAKRVTFSPLPPTMACEYETVCMPIQPQLRQGARPSDDCEWP